MTTATLDKVVEVVKARALARDGTRAFFMDNARRMWGLPEREVEGSARVQITSTTTKEEAPPVVEQPIAPPTAVVPPVEQPSNPCIDWSKALPWLVAAILSAILLVLFTILALPDNGEPVKPPGTIEQAEYDGSLFQFLEDTGQHRP